MKVAPVSADLLIKLAVGAALLGGAYWMVRKGVTGISNLPGALIDSVKKTVSDVADAAVATAQEGGATWQAGYAPLDYSHEGNNYVPKYSNPLVNDQGYDFGQLSG